MCVRAQSGVHVGPCPQHGPRLLAGVGDPATPASDTPLAGRRVRRPDQASDHRAAAGHDGSDHGRGRTRAAGGANAMNMYVDRDIDQVMDRTKKRPIVSGQVTPRAALTFAIAIEVLAFAFLWVAVNLLSAALAVAACLFYVFVYTLWLKRTSSRNIVIG